MDEYTAKPGVDWGAVDRGIQTEVGLRQFENEQKAQAIRWQGQQDYETLIKSGVDPMESLRRTAPKLFFNDPRGLASVVEEIRRPRQASIVTMDGVRGVLQPGGSFTPLSSDDNKRQSYVEFTEHDPLDPNKGTKYFRLKSEVDAEKAAAKAAEIQGPIDAKIAAQTALYREAESQIAAGNKGVLGGLFGGYPAQLREARAALAGLGIEIDSNKIAPTGIAPPAAARPWPNPFGNMPPSPPPVPSMSSQPTAAGVPEPVAPVTTNAPVTTARTRPKPNKQAIENLALHPETWKEFEAVFGPGSAKLYSIPIRR